MTQITITLDLPSALVQIEQNEPQQFSLFRSVVADYRTRYGTGTTTDTALGQIIQATSFNDAVQQYYLYSDQLGLQMMQALADYLTTNNQEFIDAIKTHLLTTTAP